jgi:hypothetical protein
MKFAAALLALFGSAAAAFAPVPRKTIPIKTYSKNMPGAVEPLGFWDPLGFAAKADDPTLKRYREAELTHGRVAMLAIVGFLVGETVEGSSFLFDSQISGPAITHLTQVPDFFWVALTIAIGALEQKRASIAFVEPENVPLGKAGLLRPSYNPGELGFDPLGLRPTDLVELATMKTKELQNGRLAMIGAAGVFAQEIVDGKGIFEHFQL